MHGKNDFKHMKTAIRMMAIPMLAAGAAWGQEEFNAVERGKEVFESQNCIVCHSSEKDDKSLKTGPNLHGLFLTEPREREVVVVASGEKKKVKADKAYFMDSLRKSWDELAVAETGETKGTAYGPIMPSFAPEVISDEDLEAVWHYVRTMAEGYAAGPAEVMLKKKDAPAAASPLEIPGEEPVADRTRVFRVSLPGMSGRTVAVGQPNGMSYAFDPRFLSVRKIWSGGFLNLKEERTGRGGKPSVPGNGASIFVEGAPVLAPLTSGGEVVDFEFKESDVNDSEAQIKYLNDKVDHAERLASLDAEYLGHRIAKTGEPSFRFRVGKNTFSQAVRIADDGEFTLVLEGEIAEPQSFRLEAAGFAGVSVDGGELKDNVWLLPVSPEAKTHTLKARIEGGLVATKQLPRGEDWAPQPVVIAPSEPGKKPLELQAGYSAMSWAPPLDLFGRTQLFEPTGIAIAKDGTIVISTRTAGVWRIRDGKWSLFAENAYESLGVWIEDDKGDRIVISQKPEITRIIDTDGDGRADVFDTVCDDFGFHGNYHEYTHGPVRDEAGNYYFLLNLSHDHHNKETSWRAGGPFMGSMEGYRGWACRVTPEGKFEPYANGLRSPAGIGFDPEGRLWYAENQGEYVGSSKWVPLEEGKFYGHISGLVSLPGMTPKSPEIQYPLWKDKLRKGAVWLPHGKLSNSPGNPAWDTTGGKFGSYQGQVFIGDQTLSTLMRIITEKVDGLDQGAVVPFARGMSSGVMRPVFLPDGSLLLGQTGRGWASNGGRQDALQQIVWDGKTVSADIHGASAAKDGFTLRFTKPLAADVTAEALAAKFKLMSWFYTNDSKYGSPQHDKRDETLAGVDISGDRLSVTVRPADFGKGDKWIDRIYHIHLTDTAGLFGDEPVWKALETYFTLRAIPK
jgi:mono/diheme cytochrome c family protein